MPSEEEREREWRIIVERVLDFSEDKRPGWLGKRLEFVDGSVERFLRPVLESPGCLERCQERLHIPVANVSFVPPWLRLRVWNCFRDAAHLEEVLIAGASIPGVQDWPARCIPGPPPAPVKGREDCGAASLQRRGCGIDAGVLDNCPRLSSTGTLRVNWVAASCAEIRPRRLFSPLRFVRPPTAGELEELLDAGYRDALEWCSSATFGS